MQMNRAVCKGGRNVYAKSIDSSSKGPFPKRQILHSSKLEGFAVDNFKFDGNVRKFSKPIKNTVGKGEIAHYEQFLLFLQCFQKTFTADT